MCWALAQVSGVRDTKIKKLQAPITILKCSGTLPPKLVDKFLEKGIMPPHFLECPLGQVPSWAQRSG